MRVAFEKTAVRRYLVHVERETAPALWLQGPGYDENLPHDLLHFVAEAELGLDGGVFGDLASGGNAGIFQPVDRRLVAKLWRRQRIRRQRLPEGRRSEQLAGVLERAWKASRRGRSDTTWLEHAAAAHVDPAEVEALLPRLDELAARWHALPPGGKLTLEWPRPERRKRHPPRERRRPARSQR